MTDTSTEGVWSKTRKLTSSGRNNFVKSFLETFLKTGKKFSVAYCVSLITFLISFPVSEFTGTHPDFATVTGFASILAMLFVVLAVLTIVIKFVHMAAVERPDNPSLALIKWCWGQIQRDQRFFNISHMLIATSFFLLGFSVLKGAIAVINPFSWDLMLRDWDKALHFGYLPHEWLTYFLESPNWVSFFNLFYNLWYFVLLSSLIVAGAHASRNPVHMRFMVSFFLSWLVAGFFIATVFSSAGPCFFERAGFGNDYAGLMAQLHLAAETKSIWALPTQDLLWQGYAGTRDGSVGISAFPSLHVTTATLVALYAGSKNRAFALLGWAFAVIILIGSVVLAWHYALDGYAGVAIALMTWKLVPRLPFIQSSPEPL